MSRLLHEDGSSMDLVNSKLSRGDRKILSLIALHRILNVSQLEAITQRSRQVIRRRLRFLSHENLILTRMRGCGRGPGRPEDIILITEKAAKLLQNEDIFPEGTPWIPQKNIDSLTIDHDLLVNWFYIHLILIERAIPDLAINPHAPGFLLKDRGKPYSFFESRIRIETGDDSIEFVPDGVFTIWHKGIGKSLLFFLEVDMGTETRASLDRNPGDIRQKILNYKALFRAGHYKRYEGIFESTYKGFRLLFLVNSPSRLVSLCRLVQEMPPSDFVWLTEQNQMFSQGLAANIWVRGGKNNNSLQSILGPQLLELEDRRRKGEKPEPI